jgi:hypothetical protein
VGLLESVTFWKGGAFGECRLLERWGFWKGGAFGKVGLLNYSLNIENQ